MVMYIHVSHCSHKLGTVYTAHSSGEGHNRNHEEDHATDYSQDVHVADLQDLQGRDLLWKEGDGGR